MKLLFINRNSVACYAIRAAAMSRWSHVAVELADGFVYESRMHPGVHRVSYGAAIDGAVEVGAALVACNEATALRFAREQLGKPYDWPAIVSWFGNRDWQDPDAWWCSEYVAAIACAGFARLVFGDQRRVTPGDLWNSPVIQRI